MIPLFNINKLRYQANLEYFRETPIFIPEDQRGYERLMVELVAHSAIVVQMHALIKTDWNLIEPRDMKQYIKAAVASYMKRFGIELSDFERMSKLRKNPRNHVAEITDWQLGSSDSKSIVELNKMFGNRHGKPKTKLFDITLNYDKVIMPDSLFEKIQLKRFYVVTPKKYRNYPYTFEKQFPGDQLFSDRLTLIPCKYLPDYRREEDRAYFSTGWKEKQEVILSSGERRIVRGDVFVCENRPCIDFWGNYISDKSRHFYRNFR